MPGIQYRFLRLIVAFGYAVALAANAATAQYKTAIAPWVGKSFDGKKCAGNQGTAGTYDYLNRAGFKGMLDMVERNHFTPGVENLTKGKTTEPMGDIDFVLSTYPNHHRALYSAMTFRLRHRKWPKASKGLPAECYYQRAMKYSPRDPVVYSQYAILAHKFKRYKQALELYKKALGIRPGDTLLNYNMGLTLVALKKYKAAAKVAREVYDDGFPLPGLKNKLVEAGYWKRVDTGSFSASAKENSTQNPPKAKKRHRKSTAKSPASKAAFAKALAKALTADQEKAALKQTPAQSSTDASAKGQALEKTTGDPEEQSETPDQKTTFSEVESENLQAPVAGAEKPTAPAQEPVEQTGGAAETLE